jgi:hypothetical protein
MWGWIGNIASLIQIFSVIPFLIAAWLFLTRARRYKRKMKELEQPISEKPKALTISLVGTDITGQVRQFLEGKSLKMEIESYYKPTGVTQGNIQSLLYDILKLKRKMTDEGVTEVHLFLACPLVFATAIGAIFDNWVPVKVYHLNRETGTYQFWTSLHKGFIPGLEERSEMTKLISGEVE